MKYKKNKKCPDWCICNCHSRDGETDHDIDGICLAKKFDNKEDYLKALDK